MDTEKKTSATLSITKEDLAAMVAAAVKAAREPNVAEQAVIDEHEKLRQQKIKDRLDNAESVKADRDRRIWEQQTCSHKHRQGQTHCVWIQESKGPGYIICQACQAKIRPGVPSPNYKGTDIYSHEMFNRLFQDCASGRGDIID